MLKLPGKIVGALIALLFAVGMVLVGSSLPAHAATVFYVSPNGNNSDGTSWANAWTNTSGINWTSVGAGSTINLDGGTSTCSVSPYDFGGNTPNPGVNCGTKYSAFTVGQNNVTIQRSTDAGHNGTVVIDGGRDTALPYCSQSTYSAPTGAATGIELNGHSGVVIDGKIRSGIVVRGAQNGVRMRAGGTDTLRNMEIFDNGTFASHTWGYSTDGNGVVIGGKNNVYDRLLVHDNGQDQFHSDGNGYDESGSSFTADWMGAVREHPVYVGEPFNDLQASGNDPGCTHADGIQIFAPGTVMSGLTVDHNVFGPGINQGLYPSDSGTGTTFNNVTVSNDLFLDAVSHNIITDNAVNGWNIHDSTIFATQGGFEIPGNGASTMTNVIKQGGYVYDPGATWTTSGNDWYLGDALPGSSSNVNPNFTSAPSGTRPSLASLLTANLTPNNCSVCNGSPIHSFSGLLSYIDSLNGSGTSQSPVVTTNAASGITSSGATLNGSVNPEGQATTYRFDYGTTTSYGSSVPSPSGSAGSGTSSVTESAILSGLLPSTTYHYRIEATNATGTSYGSDQSFTTAGSSCVISEISGPAAVHSAYGVASATTASFSPPAGSTLEVAVNALQASAGSGLSMSVTDSAGDTFTAGPHLFGSSAPNSAGLFRAYLPSGHTGMTVTAHQSGSRLGTMQLVVKVLTGAAQSQIGAASGTFDGTSSTNQSHSITTTTVGSMVYAMVGNGNAGAVLTPQSGTSSIDVWNDTAHSGNAGAVGKSSTATTVPGPVSFGWTSAASNPFIWAAQEILPATSC